MLKNWIAAAACAVFLASPARGGEEQRHGVLFEAWVRETFFDGYRPRSYTQAWDIPAEQNLRYGGVAVNPKAIQHGASVDLGDALRQYQVDEEFMLIVGFWRQEGAGKRFVKVVAPRVEPGKYRGLWGPVTLEDLRRLDALIKDRETPAKETAKRAAEIKARPPFSEAVMQVNPKIDSRGQRRLQCSLRFGDFFKHLCPGEDPAPEEAPRLFGVAVPFFETAPPRGSGN